MASDYTPLDFNLANLNFSGSYYPEGTALVFGPEGDVQQTLLFQIWSDENYIYCATAHGLGIIPL